jgi:hypothetical protein
MPTRRRSTLAWSGNRRLGTLNKRRNTSPPSCQRAGRCIARLCSRSKRVSLSLTELSFHGALPTPGSNNGNLPVVLHGAQLHSAPLCEAGMERPRMHILYAPTLPLSKIASFTAALLASLAGALIVFAVDRATRPSAAEVAAGDWVLIRRWTDNEGIKHQDRKIFAENRALCVEAAIVARRRGSASDCVPLSTVQKE